MFHCCCPQNFYDRQHNLIDRYNFFYSQMRQGIFGKISCLTGLTTLTSNTGDAPLTYRVGGAIRTRSFDSQRCEHIFFTASFRSHFYHARVLQLDLDDTFFEHFQINH